MLTGLLTGETLQIPAVSLLQTSEKPPCILLAQNTRLQAVIQSKAKT